MLLFITLLGCIRDMPRPDPGDCAEFPDGGYTWGEIGIGTCLAGPVSLAFGGDADAPVLYVTNADPYYQFTGGSLLAIPWSNVDLDSGRNVLTDLAPGALDMPHFAAGLAVNGDEAYVSTRYSDGSLTRVDDDQLWVVDISDPAVPALSSRGDDGGASVTVQADPIAVNYDVSSGMAFVGNRSSHSVSVLDTLGDSVEVVPPWTAATAQGQPLQDNDSSGSTGEISVITIDEEDTELTDDVWTLTWVEGTWRLWTMADGGLIRVSTQGAGYTESPYGLELVVDDTDGEISEVDDPAYFDGPNQGRMLFVDGGDIRSAVTDEYLADWAIEEDALLEGDADRWDVTLGGPDLVLDDSTYWLFYDGTDGESWGIGAATSSDGVSFRRVGSAVLQGAQDYDSARVSDPMVLWDAQIDRWLMYYSAYDGSRWTIGRATSVDLEIWTEETTPNFEVDGVDVAAPVVGAEAGIYRLWYSRREADTWSVGAATSWDGLHWTDQGQVATLDDAVAAADEPPGVALYAAPSSAFRLEGEIAGRIPSPAYPGLEYGTSSLAYTLLLDAGFWLGPDQLGFRAAGGVILDSVDEDAGLAWLTLIDRTGELRIGSATMDEDGRLYAEEGALLEASGEGFDADGVLSPVVTMIDGIWHMYYGGMADDLVSIGLATSADGVIWTRQGQVLDLDSTAWDGAGMLPSSVEVRQDGTIALWYTGTNGDLSRIGVAVSDDGLSFAREEGPNKPWIFAPGAPGDWDDSGVRDPWLVRDDDGEHLWYAGYDGDRWRLGYAFRASVDDAWTRSMDEATEETRPALGTLAGLFHFDGMTRPVVSATEDGWRVYFSGLDSDGDGGSISRVGQATGVEPDRLHERPLRPTLGDTMQFTTRHGDEDALAIGLDRVIDSLSVFGEGMSSLLLDEERGFLYVASTHTYTILVIDVRDDSTGEYTDENYLDVEAVLSASSTEKAVGFRGMCLSADGSVLYALNDAPDGVYAIPLADVEDNATGEVLNDIISGWLPAPPGLAADEGVSTLSGVSVAQAVLSPDGRYLYVTAYNANSVLVYDLTLGTWGMAVDEVPMLGEGPYAIALAPDGKTAVVANYLGEVTDTGEVSSTLAVIDIDEDSPTYLEVLTWIANR